MPAISCVPLSSASPSLAPSSSGSRPARASASAPGPGPAPSTVASPSPMTHQRDVGQRRQVARRAQAAARRHDRVDRGVEHRDQQLDDLGADAGQPDGQGVGAQQEHGPHHLVGQRLADAGGVATGRGCAGARRSAPGRCARRRGRRSRSSRRRRSRRRRRAARSRRAMRASARPPRASSDDGPPAPCHLDDVVDGEVPAGEREAAASVPILRTVRRLPDPMSRLVVTTRRAAPARRRGPQPGGSLPPRR